MKLDNSKVYASLVALLIVFGIPPSLHSANVKIKPVVVTGGAAPEGGTFTFIGSSFSMNNPGAVAFSASTTNSGGIYLASGETITTLIKPGDTVVVPEQILSGELVKKELALPGVLELTFSDGHSFFCAEDQNEQLGFLNFSSPLLLNDSGDIAFGEGSLPVPIFFSGGVLTDPLGCPGLIHLILDLAGDSSSRFPIQSAPITALNNAGTVVLSVRTFHFFLTPQFRNWSFLITGGTPTLLPPLVGTPAPGGGTIVDGSIVAISDSGDFLIGFTTDFSTFPPRGGIALNSTSVALIGGPTGDGRTFRSIFLPVMNNRGEVVFGAVLSDFSRAIFHWANGILTPLVRRGDAIPGGGTFFNFFEMKINDNGDIIFSGSAFGAPGSIFMLSANGGLSRVVGQGDSVPGIGTLANIGSLQFNNKGQIAFRGFLTNGKNGIFLAGAGLETEFVDPVPDLLVGSTIPFNPPKLATDGRKVTGIAADGAAQVVIRVKTGQTGNVEFSLVDEGGAALPASNMNGFLGQVGSPPVSSTVSVQAQDVTGVGPMAFAAFRAPVDFSSGPDSVEAGLPDRQVFIKIKLTTSTGETVESTEPLKIVRPPVVLVHGLWGKPDSWSAFDPLIHDGKFFVDFVDYSETNAGSLFTNAPQVGAVLAEIIVRYKTKKQVAATQADVITHSMGGLLVRMFSLSADGFIRDDNFQLGDVHKLINIGTPNFGTRLAQFLLRSPCVSQFFTDKGYPTNQGAIEDLVPNSQILSLINRNPSPLEIHQIVGLAGPEDKRDSETTPAFTWLEFFKCSNDFTGIPSGSFFDTVLRTPDHDLVVPTASQQGTATENVTRVGDVVHTQITFFLVGIGELKSGAISSRVIQLLNMLLGVPNFQ